MLGDFQHFRVVSSKTSKQIQKCSLVAFQNSNVHWLYMKPDRKTEKKLSHLHLPQPLDFTHQQVDVAHLNRDGPQSETSNNPECCIPRVTECMKETKPTVSEERFGLCHYLIRVWLAGFMRRPFAVFAIKPKLSIDITKPSRPGGPRDYLRTAVNSSLSDNTGTSGPLGFSVTRLIQSSEQVTLSLSTPSLQQQQALLSEMHGLQSKHKGQLPLPKIKLGMVVSSLTHSIGGFDWICLLIRFSLVWPLKLNFFTSVTQLWFRPFRIGSADWRTNCPGHVL